MSETETLRPTGEGATTELDPSAGNNYSCVNDDSDSTYVYPRTDGSYLTDVYATADTAIPTGSTINLVSVKVRYGNEGMGGTVYVNAALRVGSTIYYGSEHYKESGGYSDETYEWATNPAGGAWVVSDLNALQCGVSLKSVGGGVSCCSEVYMIVDYDLAAGGAAPRMW